MAWKDQLEVIYDQEDANEFLILLKTPIFLKKLRTQISDFANKKFERIKLLLGYRLNEKISFMELLAADTSEQFLEEFREKLSNSEIDEKNFLNNLSAILVKYEYFMSLQKQSNFVNKEVFENQDELENSVILQRLILDTHYEPLIRLVLKQEKIAENIPKLTQHDHIVTFAEIKPSVDANSNPNTISKVIYDAETSPVKFKNRSFIRRVFRYIKANPKKSVAATLLGMCVGIPLALTLPISGPILLITVVAGIVVGGVVGFALMALLHNHFSKKTREHTNAQIHVPVPIEAEEYKNELALSEEDQIACRKFLPLLMLVSPAIAAKSTTKNPLTLAGLIRFNLIIKRNNKIDSYQLAKEYCDQNEANFLNPIDFDFIENEFLTPSFFEAEDPSLFSYYEKLKLNCRKIRIQAFEQLVKSGQVNFQQIENLNLEEYRKLEEKYKNPQSTIIIARSYFQNLVANPEKTTKLIALYHSLFPKMKNTYVQNCNKIKNVMIYFINKLNDSSSAVDDISDQELITRFKNKFSSIKNDKISKIYSEFLLIASPEYYDLEFISSFVKSNAELDKSNLQKKISADCITTMQQPVLNCIKLFLNAVSLKDDLEYPSQKMLSLFYKKLDELSVTQVVQIFSDLRLNTYVRMDLNLFKGLIEKSYEKTRSKLRQFNLEISKVNDKEFVEQRINPKLQVIRNFLIFYNPNSSQNLTTMKSMELLSVFYHALEKIPVKNLLDLIKQKKIITDHSQGECMLLLLKNYFEFKRPTDLNQLKEVLFSQGSNLFFISPPQAATHFFKVPNTVAASDGSKVSLSQPTIEITM